MSEPPRLLLFSVQSLVTHHRNGALAFHTHSVCERNKQSLLTSLLVSLWPMLSFVMCLETSWTHFKTHYVPATLRSFLSSCFSPMVFTSLLIQLFAGDLTMTPICHTLCWSQCRLLRTLVFPWCLLLAWFLTLTLAPERYIGKFL